FFDGYKNNPEFAMRVVSAAVMKGATHLVMCDTNGGSLPHEISEIVTKVKAFVGNDATLGIHCHDDTGCAVANSMAAVMAGVRHVQGTLNGLGERTGNTNLTTVIPNLELKMGFRCLPEGNLDRLTAVSNHVAEVLNRPLNPQAPYVGFSAFAHKAGLHVSAIKRAKDAYEHIDPVVVGNGTRFVVSEMAGRATIEVKAEELGLQMDGAAIGSVIEDLKRLEHEGYHFEAADASLELLMRRASGWKHDAFHVESMRVVTDEAEDGEFTTEATVKVRIADQSYAHTADGNGPVNAIDAALRASLLPHYPVLAKVHLTDYKVRILDGATATGAITRVLLDATNGDRSWTTIGVSANIIEASWNALEESLIYGLLHASA
ncbi:MAG: citramalate synthase, partial [Actinomycetota bacterium]